jgi:hypothetical protein
MNDQHACTGQQRIGDTAVGNADHPVDVKILQHQEMDGRPNYPAGQVYPFVSFVG